MCTKHGPNIYEEPLEDIHDWILVNYKCPISIMAMFPIHKVEQSELPCTKPCQEATTNRH